MRRRRPNHSSAIQIASEQVADGRITDGVRIIYYKRLVRMVPKFKAALDLRIEEADRITGRVR